jgi:DNA polymerase-3 subunit delta
MLYILTGPDDFSLNEALEEIKGGLGDRSLLAPNTSVLDGKQVTPDQLRAVCQAMPFLAEKRLVIVEGLLERFETRAKSGRQKKAPKTPAQQNDYKPLVALVDGLPDSTVLVLVDGEIKKGSHLYKELLPRAKVRAFPFLRNDELRQWIKKRIAGEGGSISPPALDLLARLVGSNLWLMAGEVAKLVLYASGRRIEEDDVRAVVGYSQQASVFAMVDAILESRAGAGQQALQQLLQAGVAPAYLLFMLSRQVRLLVQTKELVKEGRPEVEIQDRLGLTQEFVWRKTVEQANRYSLGRLKELYHKLLEADLAIKTGKYNDELVLDILVAELCWHRV